MSTIAPTLNLKATVTSATLADGPALADDDKATLNAKIQAFVNTPEFKKSFEGLGLQMNEKIQVQLVFDGNTIKLRKKDDIKTEAVIETTSSTPIKETADLVKNMAEHYSKQSSPTPQSVNQRSLIPQSVNPQSLTPQSVNPRSLTPPSLTSTPLPTTQLDTLGTIHCANHKLANSSIQSTYGVKGIKNSGNGCFAASAYQIIANVPSLESLRMTEFPENSDAFLSNRKYPEELKSYKNREEYSPADVFGNIVASDEANQVILTTVVQKFSTPTPVSSAIKQQMIQKIQDNAQQENKHSSILGCPALTDTTNITFSSQMHSALNSFNDRANTHISLPNQEDSSQDDKYPYTALVKTHKQWGKTPPKLMINLAKTAQIGEGFAAQRVKKNKPITDIPLILYLNDYGALTEDDKKPLELKGFTVHQGKTATSGHYVAYFQKENPSNPGEYQWFCANDSKIFTVTQEGALDALSYADTLYYDDQLTSTKKPFISYTQSLQPSSSVVSATSHVNQVNPSHSPITSTIDPLNASILSPPIQLASLPRTNTTDTPLNTSPIQTSTTSWFGSIRNALSAFGSRVL